MMSAFAIASEKNISAQKLDKIYLVIRALCK